MSRFTERPSTHRQGMLGVKNIGGIVERPCWGNCGAMVANNKRKTFKFQKKYCDDCLVTLTAEERRKINHKKHAQRGSVIVDKRNRKDLDRFIFNSPFRVAPEETKPADKCNGKSAT